MMICYRQLGEVYTQAKMICYRQLGEVYTQAKWNISQPTFISDFCSMNRPRLSISTLLRTNGRHCSGKQLQNCIIFHEAAA